MWSVQSVFYTIWYRAYKIDQASGYTQTKTKHTWHPCPIHVAFHTSPLSGDKVTKKGQEQAKEKHEDERG